MYDQEKVFNILTLHHAGASSRTIAKEVLASKSGINYLIQREKNLYETSKAPRILFLDLETAPSIVASFQRWNVNISPTSVIQEGGWLISASWKFKGDSSVTNVLATRHEAMQGSDSRLVSELYSAINQADILVAYNGKRFDFPVIRTRGLINKLAPHKQVRLFDPYDTVKKMKFNSNKMQSITKYLNIQEHKIDTNMQLWLDCLDGDETALRAMATYNDQDVEVLEQVYYDTLAYSTNHPNLNIYYDDDIKRCAVCASKDVKSTGNLVYNNNSSFEEYSCNSCGHRMKTKINNTDRNKAKAILLTA